VLLQYHSIKDAREVQLKQDRTESDKNRRDPRLKRKPLDQIFDGSVNSERGCLYCGSYENIRRKRRYCCMRLPAEPFEQGSFQKKLGIEGSIRTDFSGEASCTWGDMLRCPLVGVGTVVQWPQEWMKGKSWTPQ
jgi:hypothetical protein